ncbi:MAG: hypothetical protein PHI32_14245 [Dysgonamonadaceae bacterium]|nr:hypothetical protein [Dysgonamonadaceae bacterium]
MKLSVSKALIFSAFALITLFIIFLIATSLRTKSFTVKDNVSEVYLGDSRVRYAIDDRMLDNSLNLGNSSESTYFSYFKLKQILKSSPSIRTVYLGFSYHNISSYYDQFIFGQYSHSISPNYFFILPLSEQYRMIKWNFKRLPFFLISILKSGMKNWFRKDILESRFSNQHINKAVNSRIIDERLKLQYYSNEELNSFSSLNSEYFNKIVDLCNVHQVELIILNTPMHHYYQAHVPQKFIDEYNSITDSHNLRIIDLSSIELPENGFQADGDLVTKIGAIKTTKKLLEMKKSHTK